MHGIVPSNWSQFLGRESNSHYHANMICLRKTNRLSKGTDLVVPEENDVYAFSVTSLQVPM